MPPQITLDELSVVPLHLEPELNGKKIGDATGFPVERNGAFYLVTNWHVVTQRHPATNQPLDTKTGVADADRLGLWFHVKNKLGSWQQGHHQLIDPNTFQRNWLEHPEGRAVDVVVIPLPIPSFLTLYTMDLATADLDLVVTPSEPVSIVGFPLGLTSAGKLPVWKTGHVASDIDIDYSGRPMFLIDATTKPAMSGSPVVARRVGSYRSSTGVNLGASATKFLGVYSGRINEDIDANIGFVWKPRVIEEIFVQHGL